MYQIESSYFLVFSTKKIYHLVAVVNIGTERSLPSDM